ncbi:hypothetical protein TorRG33x02_219410, partial [Trema orientale]
QTLNPKWTPKNRSLRKEIQYYNQNLLYLINEWFAKNHYTKVSKRCVQLSSKDLLILWWLKNSCH